MILILAMSGPVLGSGIASLIEFFPSKTLGTMPFLSDFDANLRTYARPMPCIMNPIRTQEKPAKESSSGKLRPRIPALPGVR